MKKTITKGLLTKKTMLLTANILISAAVVTGTILYFNNQNSGGLVYEDNATIGALPGIDLEQRREELQHKIDDSMIAFSVNTNPVFQDGTSKGNIMIENPEHNDKLLIAELYLSESNELIYQSNALKPNTYIENITLDKILPKGEYTAYIYFNAYKLDTEAYTGQTGAEITITILN